MTQPELIKALQTSQEIPPTVRLLMVGIIAALDSKKFEEYRDLFIEIINALSETDRGKAVLSRLKVSKDSPVLRLLNNGRD